MTGMPDVVITEFTDPTCPWAYSAEPVRRRLDWLYGDRLQWRTCMVGLAASIEESEARGLTVEATAEHLREIAERQRMPIDTRPRPRLVASLPACRAVVAARLHQPADERHLLRRLRVRCFSGELIDAEETIAAAARDAGIDPQALAMWVAGDDVGAALAADLTRAREPIEAARVLDAKLANWSGGRRYTCPSYEVTRVADGVKIAIPGFQPFAVHDVIFANLVPGIDRREPPERVEDVLDWTAAPLATAEVAAVCDISHDEARERLGRVATECHVGFDGFWSRHD